MSAALALAAAPAQATALSGMEGSVEACHTPGPIEATVAALNQQGWRVVEGELSPDLIELLIWPQVVFYATGDTGGEQIGAIADLQRKTVAGFARKKDIPTSKTRILTRQVGADTEAALVLWLKSDPTTAQTVCRFALSRQSIQAHETGDFAPPARLKTPSGHAATLVAMNPASLSAKSGAPVPVSGTLETQFSFPSQE